jgi:hypothetical protein
MRLNNPIVDFKVKYTQIIHLAVDTFGVFLVNTVTAVLLDPFTPLNTDLAATCISRW